MPPSSQVARIDTFTRRLALPFTVHWAGLSSPPAAPIVPVKLFAPLPVKSAVNVTADLPRSCALPIHWPAKLNGATATAPLAKVPSAAAPSRVALPILIPSSPPLRVE